MTPDLLKVAPIKEWSCACCYFHDVPLTGCPRDANGTILCCPKVEGLSGLRKHLHIYVENTPEAIARVVAHRLTR